MSEESDSQKKRTPSTEELLVKTEAGSLLSTGGGDLLSAIRHSLRTPLNQIIGYSEMLQEESEDFGHEAFIPDLEKIHTAGGQLLALINDGLAPWKIETGKIDLDMMRHEMRTPLNLIIGYSELCQEEAQEQGKVKLIGDLQKINTAAKSLLALFDDRNFPTQVEINRMSNRPGTSAKATLGETAVGFGGKDEGLATPPETAAILVVDDNEMNRNMLSRRLERQGYLVAGAENGRIALETLNNKKFDLVLLDILMPEMNGFETLERLKADPALKHIPVIMLSALDEIESAVRCIEVGAEDYVPKPFNPVLLRARISASLEKKRLRDHEQAYLEILHIEREKSERLLLNILPKSIADRLKQGESTIADSFAEVTVLFADISDFTKLSSGKSPAELVDLLNDIFSGYDWLAELHGLEKIKTIGDAYMVVGGLPAPRPDHAAAMVEMALDMQKVIKRVNAGSDFAFNVRIGISTGPAVAGIIGRKKFIYDLWGDAVNVASRMETLGQAGSIHVSENTYLRLRDKYLFQSRGPVDVKGHGVMNTYFLLGRLPRKGP